MQRSDVPRGRPDGAYAWEEAPEQARAAWRECVRVHPGDGEPPLRFTCSGWTFLLGDGGRRYYPAREGS